MSWQAYVDSSLLGSHKIDKGAIFSVAGDSVWAASSGFSVEPAEVQKLAKAFKDPSEIQGNGLYIGKQKYMVVLANDRSIYGKLGKTGVVCVKTLQAIIVGHYGEEVQPGDANVVVEKLADYLIGLSY